MKAEQIKRLMYLRSLLDTTIDNDIREKALRNKKIDTDSLRESLIYHIDEQLDFLRQDR